MKIPQINDGPRIFIFLLCLFVISKEVSAHSNNLCDTTGEAFSLEETLSPLATLFCKKRDKSGNCSYFDEDPGLLGEAAVRVSGSGRCSGVVIELQRGGKPCNKPFLLTVAHCTNPEKDFVEKNFLRFGNHVTSILNIQKQVLIDLQSQCVISQDYPTRENCLLTPQHILDDEDKIKLSGVDQALIPITNYASHLPRIRVDLNSLLKESELTECFNKNHEATIVSYLTGHHLDQIGKGHLKTGKDEDHIRADRCDDLSWYPKGETYHIKPFIGHRCPSLGGMSGSFLTMSCEGKEGKQALFVHQGAEYMDISDQLKQKAKDEKNIDPSEYQGKEGFKNVATFIDSRLLELYVKEYCNFAPLGT